MGPTGEGMEGMRMLRGRLDIAQREVARQQAAKRQVEGGFAYLASASAIFRIDNFLAETAPVIESHVFAAAGHKWKMWVKPRSGAADDCVGLYLAPATDLDQVHTADFELAIVGPDGSVSSLCLEDGRAKLQKATAGHGFPNFISRSEIERGGAAHSMLHDGCLVVTASRIGNVRVREEE